MEDLVFKIFKNDVYIDLTLYQYGWQKCTKLHSCGPRKKNHFLFHYIISGKGSFKTKDNLGEKIYNLEKNMGFIIFPEQVTSYFADEDEPWEYVWLEFDGIKAKEILDIIKLNKDFPIYIPKCAEISKNIKDEMLYIVNNSLESSLNLIAHLYLFFDYLIKGSSPKKDIIGGTLKDFYIREVIAFIEQNYQNNIKVEDIANWCNLNRSYLTKIFKKDKNISLQQFLIKYRMCKACEKLKLTSLSIKSISESVGYDNQLNFSRTFKNEFGISPSEYRIKNKI